MNEVSVSPALFNLMVDGAACLGVILSQHQRQQFGVYLTELISWNRKINLTRITDDRQIIIKHFLDSLTYFVGFSPQEEKRVIDIGSGAGFPGLPLKLAQPDLQLTLMDARLKRVVFLKQLCRKLKQEDVRCLHGRAEELATSTEYHQQYDVAVARALTQLNRLVGLAFPYIAVGGKLVVSYGPQARQQLRGAERVLNGRGGLVETVTRIKLPFSNIMRHIVVIKKCST
jgi:16S rRNA (guanine527-N7)-methyltransferase